MFNLWTALSLCIFLSSLSVLKNIPSLCWLSPSLRFNWPFRGIYGSESPMQMGLFPFAAREDAVVTLIHRGPEAAPR